MTHDDEEVQWREVADAAAALLRANNSPLYLRRSTTMYVRHIHACELRLSRALAARGYRPAQRPVCYGSTPRWPKLVQ